MRMRSNGRGLRDAKAKRAVSAGRGPTGTMFLEVGGDITKASVTGTRSSVVKVYIDAGSLSAGANGVHDSPER